ncbi:MAG: hypothetical protein M3328_09330, partial [Chloroflexota bacterium]|nr:hypothetical protein [Chloroflexota bacterium]
VLPFILPAMRQPSQPADDYSAWEERSRPTPAEEESHSADTVRLLPSTQQAQPGAWARFVQRCRAWFR